MVSADYRTLGASPVDESKTRSELVEDLRIARERLKSLDQSAGGVEFAEKLAWGRTLFDAIPDACIVVDPETERFLEVNDAAIEQYGFNRDEFLNLELSEFSHELDKTQDALRQITEGTLHRIPLRYHRKKDGTIFPVEVSVCRIDYRGRLAILGIARDISERIRALAALNEAKEYAENLVETANTFVVVLSTEGEIQVFNRAAEEISGYRFEELQGKNWFETLVPRDRYPKVWSEFERLTKGGLPKNFENPILTKTGEERHMVWQNSELTRDGIIYGTVSFGIDITDRIAMEEERLDLQKKMQHAQKLESLGVLAGGIAHDFNNLLVAILGNAELVLESLPLHSSQRKNLDGIVQGALRASELAGQMLAYSGKGQFDVSPLDLSSVVEETVPLVKSSVHKNTEIRCRLHSDLPRVEADATQIRQVIMNLVINGSEALEGRPGVVSIATRLEDRPQGISGGEFVEDLPSGIYVCLEVEDEGCGMVDSTRAKMFDPFFTTKFTGRGLGLAALLGIVRSHSGGVSVESEPGRGTRATVYFPALEVPHSLEEESLGVESPSNSAGTILIVDDEETVLQVAEQMIQSFGFKALTAIDGNEAVEIFRKNCDHIVLVILDLTMPRCGGEEAFMKLRQISSEVKVVLSSGYSEEDTRRHAEANDFSGYLQKPYRLSTLREKVAEVLGT